MKFLEEKLSYCDIARRLSGPLTLSGVQQRSLTLKVLDMISGFHASHKFKGVNEFNFPRDHQEEENFR